MLTNKDWAEIILYPIGFLLAITLVVGAVASLGGCNGGSPGDVCYKYSGDSDEAIPIECPSCGDRCCDARTDCDYSTYTKTIERLRDDLRSLEGQLGVAEDSLRTCHLGSESTGDALRECVDRLSGREVCEHSLEQCTGELGVCAEDLEACQGDLSGCGSGYDECEEQLADCLCNFTQPGEREGWYKYCEGEQL